MGFPTKSLQETDDTSDAKQGGNLRASWMTICDLGTNLTKENLGILQIGAEELVRLK